MKYDGAEGSGEGDDREEDSAYVHEAVYCGRNRLSEM